MILLFDYSVDIISINETKLDDTIKSCEVHIPGYEFIRLDRNRHGGGVGFNIKTSINFIGCSNLNVYPILKLYVLKFVNLTQSHFR